MKRKISKLEEEIVSEASSIDYVIRYDKSFQYFLAKSINRSKMTSMIYGVSINGKIGLGCTETRKPDESQKVKPKPLYEHFVSVGIELDNFAQT